jgi:8-oxo-dGTP pyrophosphatase MutT (NUDIX family)
MTTVEKNKFGDIIISGYLLHVLDELNKIDIENDSVILKITDNEKDGSSLEQFFLDIEYKVTYVGSKEDRYIYVNDANLKKCPRPIDGKVNRALAMIVLVEQCNDDDDDSEKEKKKEKHFLLVDKNDYPRGLSLPGGCLDISDKDSLSCAIRETKEETGLDLKLHEKRTEEVCAKFESISFPLYGEKWESQTDIYHIGVEITSERVENMLKIFRPSEEIRGIKIISETKIRNGEHPAISEHHLFCIKRLLGLNLDQEPKFPYLKSFEIVSS